MATVAIPLHNFIGQGDTPFLVTGRVPCDDDDTAKLVLAYNEEQAIGWFKEWLHNERDHDEEQRAAIVEEWGTDTYVNTPYRLA